MTRFKLTSALILALISIIYSVAPAAARSPYKGQKSIGLYGGYSARTEAPAAGLYFQYRFTRALRIAPSVDYVFRSENQDSYNFDFNIHTPLRLNAAETANFYPIAGVGYSAIYHRCNDSDPTVYDATDSSHRYDRLGLNLGGGLEYFVNSTLRIAIEGKWRWRKDYSTGLFTVAIGYRF